MVSKKHRDSVHRINRERNKQKSLESVLEREDGNKEE